MDNISNAPAVQEHENNTVFNFKYTSSPNKMRGIMSVKVSQKRRDRLEKVFAKGTGTIPEKSADSIPEFMASASIDDLRFNLPELYKMEMWEFLNMVDIAKVRYHGPKGHETRSTKLIRDLLKKRGIDLSPGTQENRWFEMWLANHTAKFVSPKFEYHIRWDVEAFDMLGNIRGVDDGGKSCYRADSEYWPDAPVALAAGLRRDIPTFVVLISMDFQIVARCWGMLGENDAIMITNAYYSSSKVTRSMDIFIEAIEDSIGSKVHRGSYDEFHSENMLPVYVNDDSMLLWKHGVEEEAIPEHFDVFEGDFDAECAACNHGSTYENHGFYHLFCKSCALNAHCSTCDRCGGVIHEEDVIYDDCCGNTLCDSCYNATHTSCDHCGESICCHFGNATRTRVWENGWWCEYCAEHYSTTCDLCGTTYSLDEYPEHCPNGCGACEECGHMYRLAHVTQHPGSGQPCTECHHRPDA